MEDFELTKKQIADLRAVDLRDILEYAELNTEGSKKALQDRVIEAAENDIYKLKPYISQVQSLRLRGKSRKFHPFELSGTKRSRSVLRMDMMPYFDFHSDAIITSALIPSYIENSKLDVFEVAPEFSIRFDLMDSQKELIFGANERSLNSSKARIFLRLGVDHDKLLIDDDFPAGMNILVNGKLVPLPDVLPSKPNQLIRRFPKPIDITEYLIGGIGRNAMTISWSESETRKFVFNVVCATRLDASDLLGRLRSKPVIDERTTIELIRNLCEDDALISTNCEISLCCPLMLTTRLRIPARGRHCKHVQCFDAESYIGLNQRRAKWVCPVCGIRALFCDLQIDQFFEKLLSSKRLSPHATIVMVDKQGHWEEKIKNAVPPSSAAAKRPKSSESNVISLSSDDEEERPPPEKIPRIQNSYSQVTYGYPPIPYGHSPISPPSRPTQNLDEDVITID